jgi:hypothetical protein
MGTHSGARRREAAQAVEKERTMEMHRTTSGFTQTLPYRVASPSRRFENWKDDLVDSFAIPVEKMDPGARDCLNDYLTFAPESANNTFEDRQNAEKNLGNMICDWVNKGERKALTILLKNQEELYIPGTMDSSGWQMLREVMPQKCATTKLALNCIQLDTPTCAFLFDLMSRMPGLTALNLGNFSVIESNFIGIPDCPNLHGLDCLAIHRGRNVGPLLCNMLKAIQLREIRLVDCTFGEADEHLSVARTLLKTQTKLETLSWCSATYDRVANLLITAGEKNKATLTRLSLAKSVLQCEQPLRIANALTWPRLVSLNLNTNPRLSDQKLADIIPMLEDNRCLQHLYLQNTGAGELAYGRLAGALQKNTTLASLHMDWNPEGAQLLLDVLQRGNTTLRDLRFRLAEESHPLIQGLQQCIRRNLQSFAEEQRRAHAEYIKGGMGVVLNGLGGSEGNKVSTDVAGYAAEVAYASDDTPEKSASLQLAAINTQSWTSAQLTREAWTKRQDAKVEEQKILQKARQRATAEARHQVLVMERQRELHREAMKELEARQKPHEEE